MHLFQWKQQGPDLVTGLAGDLLVHCHPLQGLELKAGRLHLKQVLGLEVVDAVHLGPQPLSGSALPDVVVRGDTVMVQYAPTTRRPVECQARWRVMPEGSIDLEVSTLTPGIWDGLAVQTRSLFSTGSRESTEIHLDSSVQPAMVIYRPNGLEVSYVEYCHPNDGISVEVGQETSGAIVRYRLFGHDLEKGVILRGRLRGAIVPRAMDVAAAHAGYARFLAEPPNLTL